MTYHEITPEVTVACINAASDLLRQGEAVSDETLDAAGKFLRSLFGEVEHDDRDLPEEDDDEDDDDDAPQE